MLKKELRRLTSSKKGAFMHFFNTFKKLIFILILTIGYKEATFACDGLVEKEGTKIIKIAVKGINEFAQKFEEYLKVYPNSLLLTDGDGVYTRVSYPSPESDATPCPRGDMPAYLAYLHEERNIRMILSSAWDKPQETFARVERHHLGPTFDLHKPLEEGMKKFGNNTYIYVKKGNVISVKDINKDTIYFRQKALAPSIILGEDFCCDQLLFIDDSKENREDFEEYIRKTPLFLKLKQIVIFAIPVLKGQILEADKISEAHLPASYKEKWTLSCEKKTASAKTAEQTEKKDSILRRSSGACGLEEANTSSLKSSNDSIIAGST